MSIQIMTKVFKDTDLNSTKKLIMLALADNANDEGFCYPSIKTICKKTSLSRPTVISHLKDLESRNIILSKKRQRENGTATTKIYIIYPHNTWDGLDEEIKEKFVNKKGGKVKELYPTQSKGALPPKGGQSKGALPLEPSLNTFNHHYKQLSLEEKELFDEYLELRKTMKLKNTISIKNRLIKKYFEFNRNKEVLIRAINANWKDFYPIKNTTSYPELGSYQYPEIKEF